MVDDVTRPDWISAKISLLIASPVPRSSAFTISSMKFEYLKRLKGDQNSQPVKRVLRLALRSAPEKHPAQWVAGLVRPPALKLQPGVQTFGRVHSTQGIGSRTMFQMATDGSSKELDPHFSVVRGWGFV
jgi:hypothetical protein